VDAKTKAQITNSITRKLVQQSALPRPLHWCLTGTAAVTPVNPCAV